MERPVAKALSDEEVADRSKRLCGLRAAVRGLKRDIRDMTKAKQDEIKACEVTMLELETQIVEGIEMRSQASLFAKEDATKALAKVAAAAGEPKPSEPHPFQGTKAKPFECITCGSSPTDPVHPDQPAAAAGNGKSGPIGLVQPEPPDPIVGKKGGKGPLGRAKKRGGKEART